MTSQLSQYLETNMKIVLENFSDTPASQQFFPDLSCNLTAFFSENLRSLLFPEKSGYLIDFYEISRSLTGFSRKISLNRRFFFSENS